MYRLITSQAKCGLPVFTTFFTFCQFLLCIESHPIPMTFTGSRLEEDAQSHPGKRTGAQHTSDGHWVGRLTLTPLSVEPLWPLTILSFLDLQDLGRSDHLTVTLRGLCRILQLQDNNLFGQREEIKNNWSHLMCARFNYQSANQIDPHEGHFFGSE